MENSSDCSWKTQPGLTVQICLNRLEVNEVNVPFKRKEKKKNTDFSVGAKNDPDLKIFSPEIFTLGILTSTWDVKKVNSLTGSYFKPDEECPP